MYCVIFDLLPSVPNYDPIVYMLALLSLRTRSHASSPDLHLTAGRLKEESGFADTLAPNDVEINKV